MSENEGQRDGPGILRVILTVIVCALVLGGAAGAVVVIYNTEPSAQTTGATRKTAALVRTVEARRGTYNPRLVVLGRVEPAQDIILSPRVSGQVTELDADFVPGGFVQQGQTLLKIDPADFKNMLAMRQSDLREARAALAIEMGRQDVARQEFELLDETINPDNRALVLREPQIESAQAQVESAQSAVEQAKLDLARTHVEAPFDAQILRRSVNLGSQVAPGDELARLVGIYEYWVIATVPLRQLHWVGFTGEHGSGSPAQVFNRGPWGSDVYREGRVTRMIGTVNEQTRMARVLVTVHDPLARESDVPPLILGSLVQVQIEGRPIADVTRLNRDYVRADDTVWVMRDGKLEIRDAEIVFRDATFAYVRDGLEDGEQVVTTNLATVAEGVGLKRVDAQEQPAESSEPPTREAE